MPFSGETPICTGTFEARDDGTGQLIPALIEILDDCDMDKLLLFLPSIHRVQRIFGDVETLNLEDFIKNITYDHTATSNSPETPDSIREVVTTLKEMELKIIETLVYDQRTLTSDFDNIEDRVTVLGEIVTRTIWRHWTPNKIRQNSGFVDDLLAQLMGNIKYASLTQYRDLSKRTTLHPFEEDSPDREIRSGALHMVSSSRGTGVSPSAEEEYIRQENLRELLELALEADQMLYDFLTGVTIEEILLKYGTSPGNIKIRVRRLLENLVDEGQIKYGWTDGFANFILMQQRNITRPRNETDQVIRYCQADCVTAFFG